MQTILVAKFEVAPSAASTQILMACTGGVPFTTGPDDDPPNTLCPPLLLNAGRYDRVMFTANRTSGSARAAFGDVELSNAKGTYDAFRNYGFSEREFTLYIGPYGGSFPDDFEVVYTAKMVTAIVGLKKVSIRLKDNLSLLEKPFCQNVYSGAGTSVGGAGAINGGSELTGRRRPRGFGSAWHYAPIPVDTTRLIYQCTDKELAAGGGFAGSVKVWDGGIALSWPVDEEYDSLAEMISTAPDPGFVKKYSAAGYFRLGSPPEYQIRTQNALLNSSFEWSLAGDILAEIASDMGVTADPADVTALNAAQTSEIGYWNPGNEESALAVMSQIAESVSVWFGFDRLGQFRMQLFEEPSGDPVYTFNDWNYVAGGIERLPPQDPAVPVWSVTVTGNRNWSPNESLATSVSTADRSRYAYSGNLDGANSNNPTVLDKHLGAQEMQVDTVLAAGFAATECTRIMGLYGTDRDLIVVSAVLTPELLVIDLNAVVKVQISRLDLSEGKLFRVVAVRLNLGTQRRVEFTLWG